MHKEFNDRNAEGFSLNDFAKPPMTSATPKPRAGEHEEVKPFDLMQELKDRMKPREHTKGPWHVGKRNADDNTLSISNGTRQSPLAYVSTPAL